MVEFTCEPIWFWAFDCWKVFFCYSFDFCSCDWFPQIFYFFPGSGYTFLRICPFLPSGPFYWHVVAHNSLLWFFFISVLSVVISPFSFLIWLIWFFIFFFLMSLANSLSNYLLNQLLVLLIFAIVTLVSFSFISALIFMISFLLLTLGFCCSFSSCFRCKVRWFIWCIPCFFFFFFEVSLYCYELTRTRRWEKGKDFQNLV